MTQQNPVTVLLTGASGFIGRHIEAALKQAGYRVLRGVSAKHCGADDIAIDFAKDSESDWQRRFYQNPIEIVINAVGVLRSSRARPIEATHQSGPIALFNACTEHNVKRVIQISALGIEDNPTDYARTKRAADEHLLNLAENRSFSAAVLRPSIVFGQGGASSALFMNLAKLPLVCLPKPVLKARVQPLAVTDLAQAVVALIEDNSSGIIQCAGSEALLLADFIAHLRGQLGYKPARVLRLPDWLTGLSARAGDLVPISPWCSETLALLAKDNVAPPDTLHRLLGREATHYSHFVEQLWKRK